MNRILLSALMAGAALLPALAGENEPLSERILRQDSDQLQAINGAAFGASRAREPEQIEILTALAEVAADSKFSSSRRRRAGSALVCAFEMGVAPATSELIGLLRLADPLTVEIAAKSIASVDTSNCASALPALRGLAVESLETERDVQVLLALLSFERDAPRVRGALIRGLNNRDLGRDLHLRLLSGVASRWARAPRDPSSLARVRDRSLAEAILPHVLRAHTSEAAFGALVALGSGALELRERLFAMIDTHPSHVARAIAAMGPGAQDHYPRLLDYWERGEPGSERFWELLSPVLPNHPLVVEAVNACLKDTGVGGLDDWYTALSALALQDDPHERFLGILDEFREAPTVHYVWALRAYGDCKDRPRAAQDHYLAALGAEYEATARAGVAGLGATPEPWREEARAVLLEALKGHRHRWVRGEAAVALVQLTGSEEINALLEALNDAKALFYVVRALGQLGPDAREALPALEGLQEGVLDMRGANVGWVRKAAQRSIKQIRGLR